MAGRIPAIRRFNSGVGPSSTPYKKNSTDDVVKYIDDSGRKNSTLNQETDRLETAMPPWILKYVDDVNAGERHFLKNAVSIFSQLTEHKDIHAEECQSAFRRIRSNSELYGMSVNQRKTQLLCITAAVYSTVSSHIKLDDGTLLKSQDSMTLLGFRFGYRPNLDAHMDLIWKKFNVRMWVIRHLKQSGVPDKTSRLFSLAPSAHQ